MSSYKTDKLKLHKWAPLDNVKRTEFNDNFDLVDKKIDELQLGAVEVNEKIGEVSEQLAEKATKADLERIGTATPKGTYATLAALETAFPTGTTGIYIVSADGKWYYWNGTKWTPGAQYQSTGIALNSIEPTMVKGVNMQGGNLYSPQYFQTGWIDNTGTVQSHKTYGRAKVPVSPNKVYSLFLPEKNSYDISSGAIIFSDINGVKISHINGRLFINPLKYKGLYYITVQIPPDAFHMEFNVYISDADNREKAIFVLGDVINDEVVNNPLITSIFNASLADEKVRKEFSDFKSSVKSIGGNLYKYPEHYRPDYYVSTTGVIQKAAGWGASVVPVEQEKKYSVWLSFGIYSGTIGSVAFYDKNMVLISFIYQGNNITHPNIGGSYKGSNYITVTTPPNTGYIAITSKRGAQDSPYDDSQTLIIVEGSVIDDISVKKSLAEINGIPIVATSTIPTNENRYSEITWGALGDSITEKNSRATKNYVDYIQEELNCQVVNLGRSGTGYKRTEDEGRAFYQRILQVPANIDVLTIFGSGNDLSLTLGTPTDTTTDTICGCINKTIDNFYTVHPITPIGIISPCPWGGYPPSSPNNKMKLYSEALAEISKLRGIPFLDLYHYSNLRPWNSTFLSLAYSRDEGNNVHPDETGHKIIAPKIREFLKTLI